MDLIKYTNETIALVIAIIGGIISFKGLMKNSLSNKIKRFDHLSNIFSKKEVDEILCITGLKDYLGVSISVPLFNFLMDSVEFYEITNVLKSCFSYIEFDEETKSIKLKEGKKPRKGCYILLYILFCIPVILLQLLMNDSASDNLVALILMAPFIYGAFQMAMVVSNRTRAINLAKKFEDDQEGDVE